ncbi:MAG: 4'-phosphopantetheinyl transferase superfamily protein, partial [Pseudomonadota bacterium]
GSGSPPIGGCLGAAHLPCVTDAASRDNLSFERELIDRLHAAVPGSCAAAASFDDQRWHNLSGAEQQALARAVDKRRREFAAGRDAAKQCARRLGVRLASLPVGPQRQPCWPETLVGSITHDNVSALAWAARSDQVQSVGLDVEMAGRLKPDTWRLLFTEPELVWLQGTEGEPLALRLFSAKESVYKCIFPRVKRYVGYKEVTLAPADGETFRVVFEEQLAQEAGLAGLRVHTLSAPHRLATWCWLPDRREPG